MKFHSYSKLANIITIKARNANHSNFGFVKYHDLNMAWKAKLAMNGKGTVRFI